MSPITVRAQGICNLFKRILLRSSYNTECVLNLFESIMEDLLIGHAHHNLKYVNKGKLQI